MTIKLSPKPTDSKTSFRQRYGRSTQGPPVTNDAPMRLRAGFVHIFDDFKVEAAGSRPGGYWSLYRGLEKALRMAPNRNVFDYEQAIEGHLLSCDWFPFYESVEFFAELLTASGSKTGSTRLRQEINQLFAEENIGFRVTDEGQLVISSSPEFIAAGDAALAATDHPRLSHVHSQLTNAFDELTLRRLDPANAVKDAVGALQGLVKARLAKTRGRVTTADLSTLKLDLHPALAGSIDALIKIEGFRGDLAGHDRKAGREVSVEEAIFVVHQCSAAIALIAAKMKD